MNPMRWYLIKNGEDTKQVRETINGFPCRLILVNDGETTLNEGQAEPTPGNTKDMGIFNFNNDKDNVNTLGLDTEIFPNCISYEVTANSDTSAGAFVPYTKSIIFVAGSSNDPMFIFSRAGYNDGDTITITNLGSRTRKFQFYYDDNDYGLGTWKQNVNVNAGNSITVTLSSSAGNRCLVDVTQDAELADAFKINDVIVTVDKTKDEGAIIINDDELSYLQNSFELRYPDADDVGSDYGYLGMIASDTYDIDYWLNGNPFTTLIDINLFPDGFPTFESFGVTIQKIVCMASATEWSGDITDYSTATDYLEGTKYISVCCGSDNGNWVKDPTFKINGEVYTLGNEVTKDTISNPREAFSTNYGLKRVIDWVGNCTDEEFVTDFDKYFNRHYTLRYYLLVVLMAGVDNLG